jgi:hypothetical protein
VLAVFFAVGVTLVLLSLRPVALTAHVDVAAVPVSVLASETMLVGAVLVGVRRAAGLAAESRSSVTFEVAWQGDTRRYVTGVRRAAWLSIMPAATAAFLAWHITVIGPVGAVKHAIVTGLWGMLCLQVLLRSAPPVVFAGEDEDEATLGRNLRWFAAALMGALALASLEQYALAHGTAYLALVATLTIAVWWGATLRGAAL